MTEGEKITGVTIYWDRIGYLLIVMGGALVVMGGPFARREIKINRLTTN